MKNKIQFTALVLASSLAWTSCQKDDLQPKQTPVSFSDIEWSYATPELAKSGNSSITLDVIGTDDVLVANGNLNYQTVEIKNLGSTLVSLCLNFNKENRGQIQIQPGDEMIVNLLDYDQFNINKLCLKNAIDAHNIVRVRVSDNPFDETGIIHNRTLDELAAGLDLSQSNKSDLVDYFYDNNVVSIPESYTTQLISNVNTNPSFTLSWATSSLGFDGSAEHAMESIEGYINNNNNNLDLLATQFENKEKALVQQYLSGSANKAELEIALHTYSVARHSLSYWTEAYTDTQNEWHPFVTDLSLDTDGNGAVDPAEGPIIGALADVIAVVAIRVDTGSYEHAGAVAAVISGSATALPTI